jgi:hypothetical protein
MKIQIPTSKFQKSFKHQASMRLRAEQILSGAGLGLTFSRPFGTCRATTLIPNAKALGYYHLSLRDRASLDVDAWSFSGIWMLMLGISVLTLGTFGTRAQPL